VREGAVDGGIDTAGRLAAARAVLRRVEDRAVGAHPAPEPGTDHRWLPVAEPLADVLPAAGLRRGLTVAVAPGLGATSLLLALLARASGSGAWAGVIGRPELGLVAAAEAGIALERLALVPYPGGDLVAVAAALLDGLDLVAVAVPERGMRAADRQRLAARARQRGAVLLPLGPWPGADAELGCAQVRWQGADGSALDGGVHGGAGRLCARRVHVRLRGRGVAPGGRDTRLLLPGPGGTAAVDTVAPDSGAVDTLAVDTPTVGSGAGGRSDAGAGTEVGAVDERREAG
jgi:hypothetical protein